MTIKIKIKVGELEIDYEGPEGFLLKSLPTLITKLSNDTNEPAGGQRGKGGAKIPKKTSGGVTLAEFLRTAKANDNQAKRFLATAVWLHDRGDVRLSSGDVRLALKNNQQNKLGNPAQCLNNNVGSGYCEKDGKKFFVTDSGRATLH